MLSRGDEELLAERQKYIEHLEFENAKLALEICTLKRLPFWRATEPLLALTRALREIGARVRSSVARNKNFALEGMSGGAAPGAEPEAPKPRVMPWEIELCDRVATAQADLASGRRIALYLYEQADASTFRYRVYNVCKALEQSEVWRGAYFFRDELDQIAPLLEKINLAVVVRVRWTVSLQKFIDKIKRCGIPLLFDVDDLIFDIKRMPLVTDLLNVPTHREYDLDFWVSHIARVELTAGFAEGYTTTNPHLGDILQKKFGREYRIIPNSLNQEQVEASAEALRLKRRNERFTIGYFSGTPTHVNDFNVAAPELARLLGEHPDMLLKVVGCMEFPPYMASFINLGQVIFEPLVDFTELQHLIAGVDVNIVPLVDNAFTDCKSELKYFEAAIVDTLTAATPTYAYRNAIAHMENGLLCREGEWHNAIEAIYEGRVPAREIIARAHSHAMENYYGSPFLHRIEAALDYFSK